MAGKMGGQQEIARSILIVLLQVVVVVVVVVIGQNPFVVFREWQTKAFHYVNPIEFSKVLNQLGVSVRGFEQQFSTTMIFGISVGIQQLVVFLRIATTTSSSSSSSRRRKGHLKLEHGFGAIIQHVLDLAGVDSDNTQQQVSAQSQSQRNGRIHNVGTRLADIGGKNLGTCQFLVAPVGGKPHLGEGALFGKNHLRVKHDCCCLFLLLLYMMLLSYKKNNSRKKKKQ
mmetsp:Transcript_10270/g.25795  ORF Transcript_10270/g.25795 Transcript_10270/m.25795 type:complete len:227 (+) Transcript_10270:1674-2354(+)